MTPKPIKLLGRVKKDSQLVIMNGRLFCVHPEDHPIEVTKDGLKRMEFNPNPIMGTLRMSELNPRIIE